jgi:hypothetical protein
MLPTEPLKLSLDAPHTMKLGVFKVPPIQGLTKNGKLKVLFIGFHLRTNLGALLGSKNKTANLES